MFSFLSASLLQEELTSDRTNSSLKNKQQSFSLYALYRCSTSHPAVLIVLELSVHHGDLWVLETWNLLLTGANESVIST